VSNLASTFCLSVSLSFLVDSCSGDICPLIIYCLANTSMFDSRVPSPPDTRFKGQTSVLMSLCLCVGTHSFVGSEQTKWPVR
jgi:hypothetical protein